MSAPDADPTPLPTPRDSGGPLPDDAPAPATPDPAPQADEEDLEARKDGTNFFSLPAADRQHLGTKAPIRPPGQSSG